MNTHIIPLPSVAAFHRSSKLRASPLRYLITVLLFSASIYQLLFPLHSSYAQDGKQSKALTLPTLERPRVQRRFQPRQSRLSAKIGLLGHIRDDYYSSWGAGVGAEYFITDNWGIAFDLVSLQTSLSDEALQLRDRYGLVPDARPQDMMITLGGLFGLGYGKLLLMGQIIHLDPLIGLHLGITTAEARTLPTMRFSFAPTVLLRHQLALRLDLGITAQLEWRQRGVVFTTGFLPQLVLCWGHNVSSRKSP